MRCARCWRPGRAGQRADPRRRPHRINAPPASDCAAVWRGTCAGRPAPAVRPGPAGRRASRRSMTPAQHSGPRRRCGAALWQLGQEQPARHRQGDVADDPEDHPLARLPAADARHPQHGGNDHPQQAVGEDQRQRVERREPGGCAARRAATCCSRRAVRRLDANGFAGLTARRQKNASKARAPVRPLQTLTFSGRSPNGRSSRPDSPTGRHR